MNAHAQPHAQMFAQPRPPASFATRRAGMGMRGLGLSVPSFIATSTRALTGSSGGSSSGASSPPIISIPGLPNAQALAEAAAGPFVDAAIPLLKARMPELAEAAAPAFKAQLEASIPDVSALRTQAVVLVVLQTAVILGVGWYFLKGPGAHLGGA